MAVKVRRGHGARHRPRGVVRSQAVPRLSRGVCVEAAGARLEGGLEVPIAARGIVLFASNTTFGRTDPRQRDLARALNRRGLGTLLFDLVDSDDGEDAANDVSLLTERLFGATEWTAGQWGLDGLPVGYVGAGLGSPAALSAAAALGKKIGAVATHSSRSDLAVADLGAVRAPTLLIADAKDPYAVAANERASKQLYCPHQRRDIQMKGPQRGVWAATPAICRWMEWHLGAPEVPYEPRLALG
jgi:putative phosphoribosyl transferase